MDEAGIEDWRSWRDRAIHAEVRVMSLNGELEQALGQLRFLEGLARLRDAELMDVSEDRDGDAETDVSMRR